MNITIFTSNQPRHLTFIESLSRLTKELFVVFESNTIFPGQKFSSVFKPSKTLKTYFDKVKKAEQQIFGQPRFIKKNNIQSLLIGAGDISKTNLSILAPALESDLYIVFGASIIKGELVNFLIEKKAINVHMGVAPYYRGSSSNFWALYDNNPEFVGATIHYLSKNIDSGKVLFHALPKAEAIHPFLLGMKAVKSAQKGILKFFKNGQLLNIQGNKQDNAKVFRKAKHKDFIDKIVIEYLNRLPSNKFIHQKLLHRDYDIFENPFIPD
jgi:hypothetical protein